MASEARERGVDARSFLWRYKRCLDTEDAPEGLIRLLERLQDKQDDLPESSFRNARRATIAKYNQVSIPTDGFYGEDGDFYWDQYALYRSDAPECSGVSDLIAQFEGPFVSSLRVPLSEKDYEWIRQTLIWKEEDYQKYLRKQKRDPNVNAYTKQLWMCEVAGTAAAANILGVECDGHKPGWRTWDFTHPLLGNIYVATSTGRRKKDKTGYPLSVPLRYFEADDKPDWIMHVWPDVGNVFRLDNIHLPVYMDVIGAIPRETLFERGKKENFRGKRLVTLPAEQVPSLQGVAYEHRLDILFYLYPERSPLGGLM
jgi:hypothetical protein